MVPNQYQQLEECETLLGPGFLHTRRHLTAAQCTAEPTVEVLWLLSDENALI